MKHCIVKVQERVIQHERSTHLRTHWLRRFRQASFWQLPELRLHLWWLFTLYVYRRENKMLCTTSTPHVFRARTRKSAPTRRKARRLRKHCLDRSIFPRHSRIHFIYWFCELTGFPSVRRYIPCTSGSSNASWKNKNTLNQAENNRRLTGSPLAKRKFFSLTQTESLRIDSLWDYYH